MSKKQTRRSVSIRGSTYDTVRDYCERHGMSMSEFVEERIAGFFGTKGAKEAVASTPRPVQTPPRTATRKLARLRSVGKLTSKQLQDAARYFTF